MSLIKNTAAALAIGIGLAIAPAILPAQATTEQPFDHSGCQYPIRATNPPNGCDNTDPACPEEIKGGSCPTPDTFIPAPDLAPDPAPQPTPQPEAAKPAPHHCGK